MMSNTPTIALILAGCGSRDGSDPLEASSCLVALSQAGYRVRCFAPDRLQREVVDHAGGRPMQDARNMMIEAARLTRGQIEPLSAMSPEWLDGVLIPGGAGVMRGLSNFTPRGSDATLAPELAEALAAMWSAGKPMVALSAASILLALLARHYELKGVRLTFGTEQESSELVQALEGWGMRHVECEADEACIDGRHRFASVPARLYARASSADIFGACQAGVSALGWLLAQQEPT
ncbi:isoprenoid biosynthesis protein ElbB [Paludibacterium sp. THUN1379]|uniref:isoprenoid biosynthesis protein ElbB n=1 Tax=Paludibacterium sp. THUN1379 TaxID=3112107 RepID=UPI0030D2C0F5